MKTIEEIEQIFRSVFGLKDDTANIEVNSDDNDKYSFVSYGVTVSEKNTIIGHTSFCLTSRTFKELEKRLKPQDGYIGAIPGSFDGYNNYMYFHFNYAKNES